VKAHATTTNGFFKTSEHETDKGGRFLYHFLIVTDRRVILWAQGLFKSSSDSFDYSDLTGVEHQKSGIFDATGEGAVVLDVHGNKANFAEMHPEEAVLIADLIRQQKQKVKVGAHTGAVVRQDTDPAAQLEKLAGLLEKGLITRDEFEQKKRKLLDQI
jgi:methionine salvage enolase-phosphatase E1